MIENTGIGAAGHVKLGGDLEIARIGFGSGQLWKLWPARRREALPLLRRALDLGVTFIDTADIYGSGVTEAQIADALHPYQAGLVIGTKGGMRPRRSTGELGVDCRPETLRGQCDASLERLGVSQLDLYQLHVVDPSVPLCEQVGALQELRERGKIKHVGLCNVSLEQLLEARSIGPIATVQNRFGVRFQTDRALIDFCERHDIIYIAHSPFERRPLPAHAKLATIAREHRKSPTQIALAWTLQQSPAIVAIPGTLQQFHLEQNVDAASIRLAPSEIAALERGDADADPETLA